MWGYLYPNKAYTENCEPTSGAAWKVSFKSASDMLPAIHLIIYRKPLLFMGVVFLMYPMNCNCNLTVKTRLGEPKTHETWYMSSHFCWYLLEWCQCSCMTVFTVMEGQRGCRGALKTVKRVMFFVCFESCMSVYIQLLDAMTASISRLNLRPLS